MNLCLSALLLWKLKNKNMTDPREKDEQAQDQNKGNVHPENKTNEETNWNENQRVDEEGNELDPDDIK